jgi:hypothetical protein
MKSTHTSQAGLQERAVAFWSPRLKRDVSQEDARQIVENVTGFFSLIAEWAQADMPNPANDAGKPAASEAEETHHDH